MDEIGLEGDLADAQVELRCATVQPNLHKYELNGGVVRGKNMLSSLSIPVLQIQRRSGGKSSRLMQLEQWDFNNYVTVITINCNSKLIMNNVFTDKYSIKTAPLTAKCRYWKSISQ